MPNIGDRFGKLVLISYLDTAGSNYKKAVFRCDCGTEKETRVSHVKAGKIVSCGCIRRKHQVSVGQRIGRLVVTSLEYKHEKEHLKVPVICDCGSKKYVGVAELAKGITKSCGCLVVDQISNMSYRHGGEGTSLYSVWHGMKVRCSNPNVSNYHSYGGRGITVCAEWFNDFIAFRSWAASHGYVKGLNLDRINVNGNYSPENCRWVTSKINGNNRRDNVFLDVFNERKTMKQWSEDERCKVSYSTLKTRITRYKWPHELALTTRTRGISAK